MKKIRGIGRGTLPSYIELSIEFKVLTFLLYIS